MGALDELTRLTETASDRPPADGREVFRAGRRRRVRRRALGGTLAASVAVLVVALGWPGSGLSERVVIDGVVGTEGQVSGEFPVPERGSASARYLEDGTPVFVSHADDGTVRVFDASDRHLGRLVVYCPAVDRLLEPVAGSTYLLDGTWTGGGPSPADLSRYPAELTDDGGRITVTGPVQRSDGRSAEQQDFTGIRCDGAVLHEPDTSRPLLPVREAVPEDGSWGWAYVRLEVFDDRSLVLCDALRGCTREQDGLLTGERLDVTQDPADYPPSTLHWALVRARPEGVEVRYAVRDIEINTGPLDGLDQVRFSIGWSPRPLVQVTDTTGVLDANMLLWLRFDPDGWFSADLPCSARYGRFELLPDDAIRLLDVTGSPRGDCDEALQDPLEVVFDEGERTLQVEGNDVSLTTPDGLRLEYSWDPARLDLD